MLLLELTIILIIKGLNLNKWLMKISDCGRGHVLLLLVRWRVNFSADLEDVFNLDSRIQTLDCLLLNAF
jgi:hypothetical protein